ncbi:hypothetical protein KEM52_002551 [Ascosphaera acerosa]|nr:hypothetical protein KEM52_002551 [Ascosphaera acerosa]
MRRRFDGYINATHILKVAGLDKPARTRILEREVQKGIHQKVQGGYGKYQGTWIPLEVGRELARRTRILDRLLPIFEFDASGASPPPVPKSSAAKAAKAPRASIGPAGAGAGGPGRRRGGSTASGYGRATSGRSSHVAVSRAATAQGVTHDAYAGHGLPQTVPAGYLPASGQPRYGASFADADEDVGSMAGVMSGTGASENTPVHEGVAGGVRDGIGDAGVRTMSARPQEGRFDEDDEDDDEYDLAYDLTTRSGQPAAKRKRNPNIDHPQPAYRQAVQPQRQHQHDQEQQQAQQGLQNEMYAHMDAQAHDGNMQPMQHTQPGPINATDAAGLDERERNHIIYSDQLLDYFMRVGDAAYSNILPPLPPPTFEVDRPVDDKGNTALHWACAMGDVGLVEDLIRRGANVAARTHMDETPLVRAVLFTNNFEKHTMPVLVDVLAETLTLRDWFGATVFTHLAATTQSRGKWRSARYYAYVLLEKMRRVLSPAELRQTLAAVDMDGNTAALKAARNGCTRLAKMLLSYAPEAWTIRNKAGECAQDVIDRAAERREQRERVQQGGEVAASRGTAGPTTTATAPVTRAQTQAQAHAHAPAQAQADPPPYAPPMAAVTTHARHAHWAVIALCARSRTAIMGFPIEPRETETANPTATAAGDATGPPSRATSPGGEPALPPPDPENPLEDPYSKARLRPRTFPYAKFLPYAVETEDDRQRNFNEILRQLYICVQSGDFSPGAVHWTRELRGWLLLKFDPTREQRIKLVKLYYELALAPGIDPAIAERFASMFMHLTRRKHYLRPVKDLILDWKPLYREIKVFVLPAQSGLIHSTNLQRSIKTLTKLCSFAQLYFDPREIPAMLEEFLPHFSTSFVEGAFVVIGLINLFIPTAPPPGPDPDPKLLPQEYLPTYFHLWSLVNRSKAVDATFIDLHSRLARDCLGSAQVPFGEYGVFTREQTKVIFTAILRMLEIPISQATSAYSPIVELSAGLGIMLDRDARKHPPPHIIARWIAMSLSPHCMDKEDSVMSQLETLMEALETMFHPSNSGHWSKALAQLVHSLADFFVMRWNREANGEMIIPEDRRLNDAIKRRFVLCLREVTFLGLYSKSGTLMSFALATLQCLAELEPDLILPRALQSIYPSLQGLVEVHRTTSSLRALQVLARTMIRRKGYRCHVPALLGLTLPGIDANDLEKSLYTLSFLQSVCYNIPFADLTEGRDDVQGNMLAMSWITGEIERMETEGTNVEMSYGTELSDYDEELILRSSTTGFGEFLTSFLGRVFTLVENLPDAATVRSGSPEETVLNTLPAVFTPLLAALSPELYDIALNKITRFISEHVIHQARDAMAFIVNALCKANPTKALKTLIPLLISMIRNEIDENGAASTITFGADILPRDRALVWGVSMLSMCVVHVGRAVMKFRTELFDIAVYMQQKCKGALTVHISNFMHHLLLNLTGTYTVDHDMFEPAIRERGVGIEQWGQRQDINDLTVKWHVPERDEIEFAVQIFQSQAGAAIDQLRLLMSDKSPIKPDGSGKGWSDEVTKNLVLLRLVLSGVSMLFDTKAVSKDGLIGKSEAEAEEIKKRDATEDATDAMEVDRLDDVSDADTGSDSLEDAMLRKTFKYPTGYPLTEDDAVYVQIHQLRHTAGEVLHDVHSYLRDYQSDDIGCFLALFNAYKTWFIDVGYERSAQVLDRVSKLLEADSQPFQVSGIRKDYPRPLLIRRAHLYHVQRLRSSANPRPRTKLDEKLLLDLVQSSVSAYTENRRSAQSAAEAALKVIWGGRILVIPPLLRALQEGIDNSDYPRMKGALFSLLYGSLAKVIGRHWKYTPTLIRLFIAACGTDKPSVQRICTGAVYQIIDYGRAQERLAVLDAEIIGSIAPQDDVSETIDDKRQKFLAKWQLTEDKKADMCNDLIEITKKSHWKIANRVVAMVVSMGLRFETIAKPELLELVVKGTTDDHPGLRSVYQQALISVFTLIDVRAVCSHNYEDFVLRKEYWPSKVEVTTKPHEPDWTRKYLQAFTEPEAEYYVDHDAPGWLVWGTTMPAYKTNVKSDIDYDDTEWQVRRLLGQQFDRQWLKSYFQFLKQEPRDASADRFRMSSTMTLLYVFELMLRDGLTSLTMDEVKEEVAEVYGDGSDKHQHRATAEILGGLLSAVFDTTIQTRTMVWEYVFPQLRSILSDSLTPENMHYWNSFLHTLTQCRDPRRSWPLIDWLTSFRLDVSSNAAFKESSRIGLLHQCILDAGWHFRLEKPIVEDFLAHLDHPYKGVRETMGQTLATITRTRYHESYADVPSLIAAQKQASSIGTRPYKPSAELTEIMTNVFSRLEKWRQERVPGQQTTSSYASGSKTVVLWLDAILSSHECITLLDYFPHLYTEQLLHMMDVKEDTELPILAYHVFRHLSNITHPIGEGSEFIDELIRIGRTSQYWHQRLRVMVNMQIVYFRRLFLNSTEDRNKLIECVAAMLEDTQHEVRNGASTTLSGMIRCSPVGFRNSLVLKFRDRFTQMLVNNPLFRKPKRAIGGTASGSGSTGASTPTPEYTKLLITRHAAVLGLGALVNAYPYASPPPHWMPEVLQTLSNKAANDPGIVGAGAKSIIGDFKKTRQDTWHVDVKVRSSMLSLVSAQ